MRRFVIIVAMVEVIDLRRVRCWQCLAGRSWDRPVLVVDREFADGLARSSISRCWLLFAKMAILLVPARLPKAEVVDKAFPRIPRLLQRISKGTLKSIEGLLKRLSPGVLALQTVTQHYYFTEKCNGTHLIGHVLAVIVEQHQLF